MECTRKIYQNTTSYVLGVARPCQVTIGVKQGCPLSQLAFELFLNKFVIYVAQIIPPRQKGNALYIANLNIQLVMYANGLDIFCIKYLSSLAYLYINRSLLPGEWTPDQHR